LEMLELRRPKVWFSASTTYQARLVVAGVTTVVFKLTCFTVFFLADFQIGLQK
jgi:hypothetical protein